MNLSFNPDPSINIHMSFITQSVSHSWTKTRSFSQLVSRSVDQSVGQSIGRLVSRLVSQSVRTSQLALKDGRSVGPCVGQSIDQSWQQHVFTCPWYKSHPVIPDIQHNLKKTSVSNLQNVVQNYNICYNVRYLMIHWI